MRDIDQVFSALHAGIAAKDLEGQTLEFKQFGQTIKQTLDVIADAVVCMANADGGVIIVGVSDRPGPGGSFSGVGPALTQEILAQGIFDRTRPPLSVPITPRPEEGSTVLVVTVPRGATHYANAKGLSTRRVGSQCRPFSPEEQRQALAARGLYDWSAETTSLRIENVDAAELQRLRRLLRSAGKQDLADSSDLQLMRDLCLLDHNDQLLWAGLLLLGTEDALRKHAPSYGYTYLFRESAGSESISRRREHRPVLRAVEDLLEIVRARVTSHPLNIAGGVQLQLDDYPINAVRELVVNAFVHRDYNFEGTVDVEHSLDRFTVSSPGPLVFGVTPENILTHPSTPRNRLLLEAVSQLHVAERTGQGVDRVYRELIGAGKAPPTYVDDRARVIVSVNGGAGNDAFVRYLNVDLAPNLARDLEVLLTLNYLRDARVITADRLSASAQQSIGDAQKSLERMFHAGLLEPSRRTARHPFPRYSLSGDVIASLGRAVSYHRRSDIDDIDQKIVDHILEYGYVTNATLRRTFDLGVYASRDLLRDLQQREILKKIGDQKSGPGVRYEAGSQFPEPNTTSRRRDKPPR